MSEVPAPAGPITAGRLLREARQAQGLHIAALASAIKVAPRKLELLEADRFDELPDVTFTRALAQTVCRALKTDPAPVLALLPRPDANRLSQVGEGLNAPFRSGGPGPATMDEAPLLRPAVWGPALLLIVAAGVYLLPVGWLPAAPWRVETASSASSPAGRAVVDSAASAASTAAAIGAASDVALTSAPLMADESGSAPSQVSFGASAPMLAEEPVASGAAGAGDASSAASASTAASPAEATDDAPHELVVHVSSDSWIEVVDANGKSLLARTVKPGESVGLDGAAPLRLRIGNAPATAVIFRGQPVALAPYTHDNLARLELR